MKWYWYVLISVVLLLILLRYQRKIRKSIKFPGKSDRDIIDYFNKSITDENKSDKFEKALKYVSNQNVSLNLKTNKLEYIP